ncbi:hypothetical protein N6H14_14355 [Paenibacillus sp. CC-CFT747]|nr:hypothetical protein N6H14_14355 [Paenibacillus sp. CC-CFT747]
MTAAPDERLLAALGVLARRRCPVRLYHVQPGDGAPAGREGADAAWRRRCEAEGCGYTAVAVPPEAARAGLAEAAGRHAAYGAQAPARKGRAAMMRAPSRHRGLSAEPTGRPGRGREAAAALLLFLLLRECLQPVAALSELTSVEETLPLYIALGDFFSWTGWRPPPFSAGPASWP